MRNKILKHLIMIVVSGFLVIILTLFLLNVYTRHGQNVIVPTLHGLQVDEAKTILESKGLHVEVIDSIYKKEAVPGAIIDQTPKPDNKVKEGRAIYVTIHSKKPQEITVPALVDYSSRQAIALLTSIGFNDLEVEEVPSQYAGLVIAVEYRGKTLVANDKVPVGAPLKLMVGSGVLTDSLSVDREYIVSPGNDAPQSTETAPKKVIKEATKLDESFF